MGTGISQIRLGEGGVIITDSLILTSKQRSIVTKKISFLDLLPVNVLMIVLTTYLTTHRI